MFESQREDTGKTLLSLKMEKRRQEMRKAGCLLKAESDKEMGLLYSLQKEHRLFPLFFPCETHRNLM
jgi:hypothetical protein